MKKAKKILLVMFTLLLIGQVLFAPFYGMNSLSEDKIHTFLGYHPIWKEIPSEKVYELMLAKGLPIPDTLKGNENEYPIDYSRYESHLNKVRLIANIILFCASYICMFLLIRSGIKIRRRFKLE